MKTVLLLFALFVFVGATLVAVSDRTWTRRTAQIVAEPVEAIIASCGLDDPLRVGGGYMRATVSALIEEIPATLRAASRSSWLWA